VPKEIDSRHKILIIEGGLEMKRKYFLLVLFFILAIFFIINASSVNAKMYKILDSEGNVICLTNNPVLSIEEKEAGYTISPPPEEGTNIEENLGDYTEKENIKKEVETQTEALIKELENQTKAEIKFIDSISRLEGNYYYVEGILKNNGKGNVSYVKVGIRALDKYGKLVSINDGYADPHTLAPGQEATYQIMVAYDSKIDKFDKTISGSVETQTEALIKELENQTKVEIKFIDSTSRLEGNYYYVEGILKNNGKGNVSYVKVGIRALDKYGKLVSINDGYADPHTLAPGQEATYQIMVAYDSKIDKFDKTVSGSVETQTEALIKEKYKIKIVDWNNRLSTYGSYIYVEGSLKNIGDKAVEEVRVKVKCLDSNGEIVSIDDGYTDPSLIAPNKEGIFQIMVKNNYKIKEFSLIILTKSTISTEVIGVKEKSLTKQIININTASLEELVCVLEISEHTAMRVIERRNKSDGFKNPRDITFLFEIGTIVWEKWIERGIVIEI